MPYQNTAETANPKTQEKHTTSRPTERYRRFSKCW